MCHRETGERRKKGGALRDVLRVSFPGLYPFIFRRTTKTTRTRKPGEPLTRFRRRRRATRDRDRATRTGEVIRKNRKS